MYYLAVLLCAMVFLYLDYRLNLAAHIKQEDES